MDLADRLSILQARADGQHAALDCQKETETTLLLSFFDALGRFCPVVQNVLDELIGEAEDGREPPAAREESPAPPDGTDANERRTSGVFEKDIVKRAFDDR